MCGIGGIISSRIGREEMEQALQRLERELHHRGPDDQGYLISRNGNVGLVNTRLAIIDLSPAGHQPMSTPDGRFHIVYNGEIYNYGALRAQLSANGYSFQSHSDTEVILALFAAEGAECVRRLEGMFAFAIWD